MTTIETLMSENVNVEDFRKNFENIMKESDPQLYQMYELSMATPLDSGEGWCRRVGDSMLATYVYMKAKYKV